jgi:hypothetical protein
VVTLDFLRPAQNPPSNCSLSLSLMRVVYSLQGERDVNNNNGVISYQTQGYSHRMMSTNITLPPVSGVEWTIITCLYLYNYLIACIVKPKGKIVSCGKQETRRIS